MKILVPITGFTRSGGSRVLSNLATALVRAGDTVDFLCPQSAAAPYFPTEANVLTYPVPDNAGRIQRWWRRTRGMVSELQRLAPAYDVVLANHHMTALPVWLACRSLRNGFYYVQAYEPEMYPRGVAMWVPRLLAHLTYRLPLVRIVNADLYRRYRDLSAEHVVEPGIDLTMFHPQGRREPAPPRIEIGCIGRHDPFKGTREIVDAVAAARQKHRNLDLRLHIAFDLPRALEAQLPDWVHRHRPDGDDRLAAFYRSCDIFIATGLVQDGGFHYPCMESLACGCTVISNYAPGTSRNCHLLHGVTDGKIAAALDDAIDEVLGCAPRRDPADLKKHSWQATAARLRHILAQETSR